jgi:hypothetical protein
MANTPIVSDSTNAAYDGYLSTTNGFYAAEAWNLGANSTTALAVSTARYITPTFAHTGNCKGIVLAIYAISSATTAYGVKVTLQEDVGGGSWTDRASKELTAAEINPEYILGSAMGTSGTNYFTSFVPFKFATPYAVDTTAGKWRFKIENGTTAGSTSIWNVLTSDATNPSFVTWCDNKATATDNDILIIADKITIDKSFTTGAALGTGDTVVGVAGWVCRSSTITKAGVCLLEWDETPAASYTLTIGGCFLFGKFSGFRIGTSTNKIPNAQKAIVTRTATAVAGTTTPGSYQLQSTTSTKPRGGCSLFLYGAIPAHPYAVLAEDANSGQADIVVTEDLSADWQVGDYVYVGKQDYVGQGTVVWQQIQSISGTTITLSSNLLTYNRKAGGIVLNRDRGWGININGYLQFVFEHPQYLEMSGCALYDTYFSFNVTSSYYNYPILPANRAKYIIEDNLHYSDNNAISMSIQLLLCPPEGVSFKRNYSFRSCALASTTAYYTKTIAALPYLSGTLEYHDNIALALYSYGLGYASTTNLKQEIEDNIWQNGPNSYGFVRVSGLNPTLKRNVFWGCSTTMNYGAVNLRTSAGLRMEDNSFDGNLCSIGVEAAAFIIDAVSTDDLFGVTKANTSNLGNASLGYYDITFNSPTGTITFDPLSILTDAIPSSKTRIVNEDDVANTDLVYSPTGNFVRTGDGLTDTTVHTSGTGKFALRFEPTNSPELLTWTQNIPTGNIQNKTAGFAVWVKINAEAYWAGTKRMPRLNINYDDGTVAYAEAAETTDWQLLFVPVTPTTTFGQVTAYVDGYTDATTTNAYFYVDDFSVFLPPGVQLDLGGMDLWANALPITPSIATNVTAADVWNIQTSTLTSTGSAGKLLVDTEKKVDDNQALIISQ